MTENMATFVRDVSAKFNGIAYLYRCSPPMPVDDGEATEHVVVSAAYVPLSGAETYIFPADAEGAVTDWGEMDGSRRGTMDHVFVLQAAGYQVEEGVT